MNAYTKQQRRLLILILLTLAFIWGNSLLPGELSGRISDAAARLAAWVLHQPLVETSGGGILRKLAHGTEFLVLGLELSALCRSRGRSWSLPLLLGLLTAMGDETIQRFVADRAGQLRDVWIDFGGLCTGVGIWYLRSRKKKAQ